jgi:hypothetical protein
MPDECFNWKVPFFGTVLLAAVAGCVNVKTEPIRVEPIFIEITINHRVQEELDSIFGDIDRMSETTDYSPLDDDPKE